MRGILIPRRSLRPAVVAAPTPNMLYHFDAADLTDPDGTALASWTNQGVVAGAAVQNTAAAKPLVKTAVLNGLRVVRFDGVDDVMYTGTEPQGTFPQPTHHWVVANLTSGASTFVSDGGQATGRQHLFGRFGSGEVGILAGNAIVSAAEATPSGFHRWRLLFDGASSTIHKDNGGVAFASGSAGLHDLTGLTFGASSGGSSFGACDIAEVIVYNRILTAAEITTVETYLSTKWGV